MNLRDLKYLIAVAKHKHFGKAAEACFISQPTLSAQLKKIENELNVQLFERTNKQVLITPIGEALIHCAKNIIAEVEKMKNLAQNEADPYAGLLRVGIIPTLGPYLLPHVIPHIKKNLPKVKLYLREDLTNRILVDLHYGELDVVILATPVENDGLEQIDLFEERFFIALPHDHSLANKSKISLEDIHNEQILLLEDGHCLREQALQVCHLSGAKEKTELRATSLETLRQMVGGGSGITFLPQLALRHNSKIDDLLHISAFNDPKLSRTISLLYRKSMAKSLCIQKIASIIKEVAKKLVGD